MAWIWAKLISGLIFVLIPGFALKENFKNHPYLTVLSLILGIFLLFLSLKPLVQADNELENIRKTLYEIQKNEEKKKLDKEIKDKKKIAIEKKEKFLNENKISVSNDKFFEFHNETRDVNKIRFSYSGKYILGAGYKKIKVWDLKTKKLKAIMSGHLGTVTSADFSPNDKYVVSGGYDGTVRLWDTLSGKLIKKIGKHDSYVESVQFSSDGKYIISAGLDNVAKLWNVKNKKLIRIYKGHTDWIDTVRFTDENKKLLTGSRDNSIILWDIENSNKIKIFYKFNGADAEGATDRFDNDNKYIYGVNQDGIMRWDIKTGDESLILTSKDKFISVALSKDSRFLLAGTKNTVKVYNLITKELVKTIQIDQIGGVCDWINSLTVSYDNKYIAVGGCNNKISIWKVN